tara:strand:- start:373 stop:1962 length:1590 start_codon:yes stop_codon:yes gene_type:complete
MQELVELVGSGTVLMYSRQWVDVPTGEGTYVVKRLLDCTSEEYLLSDRVTKHIPISRKQMRKALRDNDQHYKNCEAVLYLDSESSQTSVVAAALVKGTASKTPDVEWGNLDDLLLDLNKLTDKQETAIIECVQDCVDIPDITLKNWLYGESIGKGKSRRTVLRPQSSERIQALEELHDDFKKMGEGSLHYKAWRYIKGVHCLELHDFRNLSGSREAGILRRAFGRYVGDDMETFPHKRLGKLPKNRKKAQGIRADANVEIRKLRNIGGVEYKVQPMSEIIKGYPVRQYRVAYRATSWLCHQISLQNFRNNSTSYYQTQYNLSVAALFHFLNSLFSHEGFVEHRFRNQYAVHMFGFKDTSGEKKIFKLIDWAYKKGELDNYSLKTELVDAFESVPTTQLVTDAMELQRHFPRRLIDAYNISMDGTTYELMKRNSGKRWTLFGTDGKPINLKYSENWRNEFGVLFRQIENDYLDGGLSLEQKQIFLNNPNSVTIEELVKRNLAIQWKGKWQNDSYMGQKEPEFLKWVPEKK